MPKKEEDKGPFQAGFTPSASTTTSFFDRKKNNEECKLDVVDLFVCVDVHRLLIGLRANNLRATLPGLQV